ncbi:hypothetical protein [Proteus terrae]|uniref:hypothetical protein n=1 Tax=Proteus terrae TaxID=1574161 RepID=UPI00384ABE93
MIEIPFSFFGITDWILDLGDPIMIIMLATFGTLFSMVIILPLMSITPLKKYMSQIAGGLFSSVFVSLMVLISFNLILGVNSALKLLLIWWVILFSCITYWFINYRYMKDVAGNKFAKFQEKALEAEEKRRQNRKSKK